MFAFRNLRRHQKICESRKNKTPWTCTHFGCAISLRTFTALVTHVKIYHTGNRQYKCEYCEKSYATKGSIAAHLKCCRVKRQHEAEMEVEVVAAPVPIQNVQQEMTETYKNPGLDFQSTPFPEKLKADSADPIDVQTRNGKDGRTNLMEACKFCGRILLRVYVQQHQFSNIVVHCVQELTVSSFLLGVCQDILGLVAPQRRQNNTGNVTKRDVEQCSLPSQRWNIMFQLTTRGRVNTDVEAAGPLLQPLKPYVPIPITDLLVLLSLRTTQKRGLFKSYSWQGTT